MIGPELRKFFFAVIAAVLVTPVQAVEIHYDARSRPVKFIDLDINGRLWNVSVTWTGAMVNTYGANKPTFLDDDMADVAAAALRQALIDDNYTSIGFASYLWVPKSYVSSAGFYTGPGVFLHQAGLPVNRVDVRYNTAYGTVGFTRFRIFEDSFED